MKKYGFTLLEFLISVSLTILLLTMGLPSLASLITTSDSNIYSRNLLDHLIFGQRQAITQQQTVTACLATPVSNATTESCITANQTGAQRMLYLSTPIRIANSILQVAISCYQQQNPFLRNIPSRPIDNLYALARMAQP